MSENKANKVKYGLKNVHWALATEGEDGALTFGTPTKWPGAVSLSLPAEGEDLKFYADDGIYFARYENNGYAGDLETALVPDAFSQGILGDVKDANGVLLENANAPTKKFALLFEFTGDAKQIRHVLYNCTASRPELGGSTRGQNSEVKTESISLTAGPAAFGDDVYVKAKTGPETTDTVYGDWYKAVYVPGSSTEASGS